MEERSLQRSVGLSGAAFILIGYVVGGSIFILPGTLAASAGPGLFISYLIAAVLALFTCFVTAQIGSAIPTSGANYIAISRIISPFWGFMFIWTLIVTVGVGVPLIAYGFAEYLAFFIPGTPPMPVAVLVILFFVGINILGIQLASRIQAVMVLEFLVALFIFGIGGAVHSDANLLTPLFPMGIGAVLIMAIPAYFSYSGFFIIAEIGEEIKNPSRNIPRALLISFFVVLCVYTLIPLAVTGVLPWGTLGETKGAVAVASEVFFPKWLANIIALSALFAIATSINGIVVAHARDIFAAARDTVLPLPLSKVNKTFKTPFAAILLVGAISFIGVLVGATIRNYAIMTVLGFMIIQSLSGLAVFNLPKKLPERYAQAKFKLKGFALPFFSIGLTAVSAVFLIVGVIQSLASTLIYLGLVALGAALYFLRKNALEKQGMKLKDILTKDLRGVHNE
ncbi:MAG: amino acid permease [Candidatus Aminicenantes bacterium]|nr:amino acid permease [Candidatus Aminicenantes bacterium]